uniref:Uncharacterized protein n=1 Tax=Solanum lycopersicum TaxID=4081 RepID=A0A3Q7IYP0_SOLLC
MPNKKGQKQRVPGGFQAERLTEMLEERHGGLFLLYHVHDDSSGVLSAAAVVKETLKGPKSLNRG